MPAVQPAPSADEIRAVIEEHLDREGPLLPILHGIQERFGHVPQSALPRSPTALNLTRAEVHGVVSFYHDFRATPAGRHVRPALPGRGVPGGGRRGAWRRRRSARLGVDWHGTTPDGAVTVEPVYCLGLCACGPAAMVDGTADRPGRRRADRGRSLAEARMRAAGLRPPRRRGARALGADAVPRRSRAEAARRGLDGRAGAQRLPRDGLARAAGRGRDRGRAATAFGPVAAGDVAGLFDAGFGAHPLALGPVEEIPFFARPDAARPSRAAASIDPLSLDEYEAHGGLAGLRRALAMDRPAIVDEVKASGPARARRRRLPDRHQVGDRPRRRRRRRSTSSATPTRATAAPSPTGCSWRAIPSSLIEGMAIAGIAVGATKGYVYIRSEYPDAIAAMQAAIGIAREAGLLGPSVLGSGPAFDMEVRRRRRRLCLRRGDEHAEIARGQARAWSAPSRRCRRSRGCSAGRPWSTT